MQLTSQKPLSTLAKSLLLNDWETLVHHIKHLPYGRNANRDDFSLVLKEQQGSCSSKHALLKAIALENNWDHIKLVLAIFKMNSQNIAKLSPVLDKHQVAFIPEAHCYLQVNDTFLDITNANSNFLKIEQDIIETQFIEPHQVVDYKVEYHKRFLKSWLESTLSQYSFEDFWSIRDQCITTLSQ